MIGRQRESGSLVSHARRLAPLVGAFAALLLFASPAAAQRSGNVDGHYYKWIFEGEKFIVCTNISKERGEIVSQYLEWAFSAMTAQFDADNRHQFLKKWEVNFHSWGTDTGRTTGDGDEYYEFNVGGKQAVGFRNEESGWTQILLLPERNGLNFHARNTHGNKLIVHYAGDNQEEGLIRRAFGPVRDNLGAASTGRAFFFPPFGVLLIDEGPNKRPLFNTLDTAVHEACHYMFEFASFVKPTWFNEGYCYFLQVMPDGGMTAGEPRFDFLQLIRTARKERKFVPLSRLIGMNDEEFRRDPNRESLLYAESWALFSFLNSDASGLSDKFLSFYNRMRDGEDAGQVFRSTFNLPDLERRVLGWCDTQLDQMLQEHVEYYDHNNDGKPDHWNIYGEGYLQQHQYDNDFDGRPEVWVLYWPNGTKRVYAKDENLDGEADLWQMYDERGNWTEERADRNHDGNVDIIYYISPPNKVRDTQKDDDYDGNWD